MNVTKIYLYFEIFEKNEQIYICGTDFSEIFKKNKKLLPRIRLAFPIQFLRFANHSYPQKQDPFKKSRIGPFWG